MMFVNMFIKTSKRRNVQESCKVNLISSFYHAWPLYYIFFFLVPGWSDSFLAITAIFIWNIKNKMQHSHQVDFGAMNLYISDLILHIRRLVLKCEVITIYSMSIIRNKLLLNNLVFVCKLFVNFASLILLFVLKLIIWNEVTDNWPFPSKHLMENNRKYLIILKISNKLLTG